MAERERNNGFLFLFLGLGALAVIALSGKKVKAAELPLQIHTICDGITCKEVAGEGVNECILGEPCAGIPLETHFECQDGQCVEIEGEGLDECQGNLDCPQPFPTHTECIDGNCEIVEGVGVSQCNGPADCPQPLKKHTICDGLTCKEILGAGVDECVLGQPCAGNEIETHFVCQGGQCIEKEGAGTDKCVPGQACFIFSIVHQTEGNEIKITVTLENTSNVVQEFKIKILNATGELLYISSSWQSVNPGDGYIIILDTQFYFYHLDDFEGAYTVQVFEKKTGINNPIEESDVISINGG